MPFFTMFDPLYLLLALPGLLLSLWAQFKVKSAFSKYKKIGNSAGLTGAQAAQEMLRREGVLDCRVEQTRGFLSDHYDPREKVLRLSPDVYAGRSIAAVGIACHEAGHALQHAQGYAMLGLRTTIVPVAQLGSTLGVPMIIFGAFLGFLGLAKIGFVIFCATFLFQMVTLPVEFNASSRAKAALTNNGVIAYKEEIDGVNSVLDAAAMTYVAAAIAVLGQLLYYAIRLGLIGGSDD